MARPAWIIFANGCVSIDVASECKKGNLSGVFRNGTAEECGSSRSVSLSFVPGKMMRLLLLEREIPLKRLEKQGGDWSQG